MFEERSKDEEEPCPESTPEEDLEQERQPSSVKIKPIGLWALRILIVFFPCWSVAGALEGRAPISKGGQIWTEGKFFLSEESVIFVLAKPIARLFEMARQFGVETRVKAEFRDLCVVERRILVGTSLSLGVAGEFLLRFLSAQVVGKQEQKEKESGGDKGAP
jgi:hypothetical protein